MVGFERGNEADNGIVVECSAETESAARKGGSELDNGPPEDRSEDKAVGAKAVLVVVPVAVCSNTCVSCDMASSECLSSMGASHRSSSSASSRLSRNPTREPDAQQTRNKNVST
jgi:hypothetical protein